MSSLYHKSPPQGQLVLLKMREDLDGCEHHSPLLSLPPASLAQVVVVGGACRGWGPGCSADPQNEFIEN